MRFDEGEDRLSGGAAREARQLLEPGRARHVHLDQFFSDEIQADEIEPPSLELGPHGRDQLFFARGECRCFDSTSDMNVRSKVTALWDTADRPEQSSVEEQYALVSRYNGRFEALHHGQAAPLEGQDIDEGACVFVSDGQAYDAAPACAVEGLQYYFSSSFEESLHLLGVRADDGFGHPLGEGKCEKLLVGVTEGLGIVHDERVRRRKLEYLGQVQVGSVEWRVLANEDRVEVAHPKSFYFAQRGRRSAPPHLDGPRPTNDFPPFGADIFGQAVEALMSPSRCLFDEGEGGVLLRVHGLSRVHREQKAHGSGKVSPEGRKVKQQFSSGVTALLGFANR